jgi:hypothetical protein
MPGSNHTVAHSSTKNPHSVGRPLPAHREHPGRFNLLVFGVALGILTVAMLLRTFLDWLGK